MNSFSSFLGNLGLCDAILNLMEKIKIKKCFEDPDVVDFYIDLLPVYTEYCLKY